MYYFSPLVILILTSVLRAQSSSPAPLANTSFGSKGYWQFLYPREFNLVNGAGEDDCAPRTRMRFVVGGLLKAERTFKASHFAAYTKN